MAHRHVVPFSPERINKQVPRHNNAVFIRSIENTKYITFAHRDISRSRPARRGRRRPAVRRGATIPEDQLSNRIRSGTQLGHPQRNPCPKHLKTLGCVRSYILPKVMNSGPGSPGILSRLNPHPSRLKSLRPSFGCPLGALRSCPGTF